MMKAIMHTLHWNVLDILPVIFNANIKCAAHPIDYLIKNVIME